jgi:imidazoleglycerol-phosphate dehydratase
MTVRTGTAQRATSETRIDVTLVLDGTGRTDIRTGIGFYDHMLTAWALNARFDLVCHADGDLHVSQHHTVEDVGIVIGSAFRQAVGDKVGIRRYGQCLLPMDEALVRTVLDLSGRAFARLDIPWRPNLGPVGFDYALTSEFFWAFARAAHLTVHVDALQGANNHHMCEAAFKGFGRALDEATRFDAKLGAVLPSTKGGFDG